MLAKCHFPCVNSWNNSNEKVEKVVNEPQTPMVKNSNNFSFTNCCFAKKPKINPISKLPIRLTKSVEVGKDVVSCLGIAKLNPYLAVAPRKPPNPTIKIFCHIYFTSESNFDHDSSSSFGPTNSTTLVARAVPIFPHSCIDFPETKPYKNPAA